MEVLESSKLWLLYPKAHLNEFFKGILRIEILMEILTCWYDYLVSSLLAGGLFSFIFTSWWLKFAFWRLSCKHFGCTWIRYANRVCIIILRGRLFPFCSIKTHVDMLSFPFLKLKLDPIHLNWEVKS